MLRPLALALVLFACPDIARAAEPLTPAQAAGQVGQTVTVEFTVRGVGSNPAGFAELYSEEAWKAPGCFFVRLAPEAVAKLAARGVAAPDACKGETVRATGTVGRLDFGPDGSFACITPADAANFEVRPRAKPYTATSAYRQSKVRGRTVLVHPALQSRGPELAAVLAELGAQLGRIDATVPEAKLAALGKVRFWLEWDLRPKGADRAGGGAFHPSADWLRDNDYNPDKAGDIELCSAVNFVAWSRKEQPCMVLHELAHAYHHLVLGADHAGIKAAFAQAAERKLYDRVAYVNGGAKKAYAATNPKEYYAELTEAYFGRNDFFPFTKDELRAHDPVGLKLMRDTWGVR